jgi:hypothetical protein
MEELYDMTTTSFETKLEIDNLGAQEIGEVVGVASSMAHLEKLLGLERAAGTG